MTQAKDLKSDLIPGLNDTMLDLGKRLEKAQNENDKIYFDKVNPLTFPNLDPGLCHDNELHQCSTEKAWTEKIAGWVTSTGCASCRFQPLCKTLKAK